MLGVAPLGASDGEGTYFPVDHDEYVTIPGAALAAVNGQYEIRVTEELSEVSYLDQIKLYAVDHPAATEIFTNEKFKGPPYPEYRLYGVDAPHLSARPRATITAAMSSRSFWQRDQRLSRSVSAHRDWESPDLHTLELDFGRAAPNGHAVLLLNGWVDWPDGSTFRAASQEFKGGLVMPYLQVQDAAGAVEDGQRRYGHAGRQAQDHRGRAGVSLGHRASCASSPTSASIGTRSS